MMAVGAYRPLDDALRIAFTELIALDSRATTASRSSTPTSCSPRWRRIHLTEMVDPNYVVIANVEKKFLPPKK